MYVCMYVWKWSKQIFFFSYFVRARLSTSLNRRLYFYKATYMSARQRSDFETKTILLTKCSIDGLHLWWLRAWWLIAIALVSSFDKSVVVSTILLHRGGGTYNISWVFLLSDFRFKLDNGRTGATIWLFLYFRETLLILLKNFNSNRMVGKE